VFSVMRGSCRVYISEPNSEARRGRNTEESRKWERSKTERTKTRIESVVVRCRSEFRESAVEGIRL
jgi:hypothetical protein